MRFQGKVRFPDREAADLDVTVEVTETHVRLASGGESLGSWCLSDVVAHRVVANEFELDLEGEVIQFVAEDQVNFAYGAVQGMAEGWARYHSMNPVSRRRAVAAARRANEPSRLHDARKVIMAAGSRLSEVPPGLLPESPPETHADPTPAERTPGKLRRRRLRAGAEVGTEDEAADDVVVEPASTGVVVAGETIDDDLGLADPDTASAATDEAVDDAVDEAPVTAGGFWERLQKAMPAKPVEDDPADDRPADPAPPEPDPPQPPAAVPPGRLPRIDTFPGRKIDAPAPIPSPPPLVDTENDEESHPPRHRRRRHASPARAIPPAAASTETEPALTIDIAPEQQAALGEVDAVEVEPPRAELTEVEPPEAGPIQVEPPEAGPIQVEPPEAGPTTEPELAEDEPEPSAPEPLIAPVSRTAWRAPDAVEPVRPESPRERQKIGAFKDGHHPAETTGLRASVKSIFGRSKIDHEHAFVESTTAVGLTRRVCLECGHVSIGVSD